MVHYCKYKNNATQLLSRHFLLYMIIQSYWYKEKCVIPDKKSTISCLWLPIQFTPLQLKGAKVHPPTYIPIMDEALLYFPRLCMTHKFNWESLGPIKRSVRDLFGHLVVAEALVQKHVTPISLFDTVTRQEEWMTSSGICWRCSFRLKNRNKIKFLIFLGAGFLNVTDTPCETRVRNHNPFIHQSPTEKQV